MKSIVGPITTLIDRPVGSPADIVNSALFLARRIRKTLNNRLTGSGAAVGDARIRAGAVIQLEGLGPDFSGNYRVTSATHALDADGYKTYFKVQKEIIP
jgi:phage protein D